MTSQFKLTRDTLNRITDITTNHGVQSVSSITYSGDSQEIIKLTIHDEIMERNEDGTFTRGDFLLHDLHIDQTIGNINWNYSNGWGAIAAACGHYCSDRPWGQNCTSACRHPADVT